MEAHIVERPSTFDRVDRVKELAGQTVCSGDDRLWILGDRLVAVVGDGPDRIEVPKGFTTDGASVPRLAQIATGWGRWEDPQRWAAIVHDWSYCARGVPKSYSDHVFRDLLRAEGASRFKTESMYGAVTVGGWLAYRIDQRQGPSIWV